MNNNIDRIFNRIRRHGNGWAFSSKDFMDLATTSTIATCLDRLTKNSKIRRLGNGIYDIPRYSNILEDFMPPDLHKVAYAFARKFSWTIQPTGNTALNRLGLSTQVPTKIVYLSDGPTKTYTVQNQQLQFKKTRLKDSKIKTEESRLIIQALRALGQSRVDSTVINKIRSEISPAKLVKVEIEAKYTTGWIYEIIRKICETEGST